METRDFFVSVLKAAALSLIFGLCGVLIFALIVKFAAPTETVIQIVNQIIKVLSVFLGCVFAVKGKLGIVKGGVSGAVFTVLLYAVFAIMSGARLFSLEMLIDFAFTAVIGAISGIIAVNMKGRE